MHGLFRIRASKGTFEYMFHVDAQCNLSSFCTRQRQERTSPQRNRLHAKENKNLRCVMFFFAEFRQTNHVLYHVTLSLCQTNIIIRRWVFPIINNGHTLVTQDQQYCFGRKLPFYFQARSLREFSFWAESH